MPRIQVSLLSALLLLATSVLPSQPSRSTAAFNESAVTNAVEVGLPAEAEADQHDADEAEATVVAASLSASTIELALFGVTNAERARAGLPPLSFNDGLLGIARQRAGSQVSQPNLSHMDGSGQLAFTQLLGEAGVFYQLAGENLARVPAPAVDAAERADYFLMQSPSHRANILDPRFTSIAIGSALDSNGAIIFAQIFHTAD